MLPPKAEATETKVKRGPEGVEDRGDPRTGRARRVRDGRVLGATARDHPGEEGGRRHEEVEREGHAFVEEVTRSTSATASSTWSSAERTCRSSGRAAERSRRSTRTARRASRIFPGSGGSMGMRRRCPMGGGRSIGKCEGQPGTCRASGGISQEGGGCNPGANRRSSQRHSRAQHRNLALVRPNRVALHRYGSVAPPSMRATVPAQAGNN